MASDLSFVVVGQFEFVIPTGGRNLAVSARSLLASLVRDDKLTHYLIRDLVACDP